MLNYIRARRPAVTNFLTWVSPILAVSLIGATAVAEDLIAPFHTESSQAHQLQVINTGVAGLQKRLEMINRAQTFIDAEYFIYSTDEAGRLVTQALVRKKLENPSIKIRLLVDASPTVVKLKSNYVSEIQKAGIEVKYYNPASLLHLIKTQYRDHRKLLVVDSSEGVEAITGGRNIADEYFDLNPKYNFLDRDIFVRGPITQDMSQSFDQYWDSDRSKSVPEFKAPNPRNSQTDEDYQHRLEIYQKELKAAQDFLVETDHDRKVKEEVAAMAAPDLADPESSGSCEKIVYVTDLPGFDPLKNDASPKRQVLKTLLARIGQIPEGEEFTAESPYFIIYNQAPTQEMQGLSTKKITATLLTNSLGSTDAFYVAANFVPRARFYADASNGNIYLFSGYPPNKSTWIQDAEGVADPKTVRWGIHAKTYVFGKDSFAIGTFNLDPRSANLNSEMMLMCDHNERLTNYVLQDINSSIAESRKLSNDGLRAGKHGVLYGASTLQKIEYYLSIIPATLFEPLM